MARRLLRLLLLLSLLFASEAVLVVPLRRSVAGSSGGVGAAASHSRLVPMPSFDCVVAHARGQDASQGCSLTTAAVESTIAVDAALFTFPSSHAPTSSPPTLRVEPPLWSSAAVAFHPNDSAAHSVPLTNYFRSEAALQPHQHSAASSPLMVADPSSPCALCSS